MESLKRYLNPVELLNFFTIKAYKQHLPDTQQYISQHDAKIYNINMFCK